MIKHIVLFFLFLAFVHNTVWAQSSIKEYRLPEQVIGGLVVGTIGGFTGAGFGLLVVSIMTDTGAELGWGSFAIVANSAVAGFTVGNGFGVHGYGNSSISQGRLGATLVGSAAGLLVAKNVGPRQGDHALPFLAASVTLGSMLGFQVSRYSVKDIEILGTSSTWKSQSLQSPFDPNSPQLMLIRVRF